MSTTIDQQVVEMRFDNQHFEKNVKTSMSTLDRLKQSLNLTGASKGLENINAAAKNNNMGVLGQSVEAVRVKFSALQIMGITALQNITNSAINAGKRIASALTIDPVKSGFQEYETQINSIQTILANTQSKGTTLDDVNNALDTLNKYADKTIYNFTEMTRNIGTFTAAGIDLETSVTAIQGIANLAAVSGSTSQQASTAMYQLSQALAAGTVKLMDWNSVVNAGMGGQVFQDALKETARAHGVAIDQMIKDQGSFRETLSQGWITSEVLTETLQKFTLTTEGLTEEQIKANREMLKAKGYNDDQIDSIFQLGETATNAATKVKTFTQLWDTLKEAAQSGWTQTWELIVGDFDEAKSMLTSISDYVGGIIGKFSDRRNNILSGALTSKWDQLADKIKDAGYTTEQFEGKLKSVLKKSGVSVDDLVKKYGSLTEAIKAGKVPVDAIREALKNLIGVGDKTTKTTNKVSTSIKDLDKIANKGLVGTFGNGEDRVKALTEAGYDYAAVQNKINEILGDSTRHTTKLTEKQKESVVNLSKLSDEQLKNKGYTDDQIKALKELKQAAEGTDSSLSELIDDLERPSGRTLLLESFQNMWKEIEKIFKLIGEAWKDVFGDKTEEEKSASLYNMIEKFHALTESMTIGKKEAENFKTIMEGLLSLFKLGGSLASKSLLGGLKLLNAVLNLFGSNILDVASKISEYIIAFNKWVETNTMFGFDTVYNDIARVLGAIYEGLKSCIEAFIGLEKVSSIIETVRKRLINLFNVGDFSGFLDLFSPDAIVRAIKDFFENIEAWIKNGSDSENLGLYIVQGLVNGILTGTKKLADIAIQIGKAFINSFCTLFGIASPSKLMFTLGGFIIAGLVAGLMAKSPDVGNFIKTFGSSLISGFKQLASLIATGLNKLDLDKIISVGLSVGLIYVIKKLTDALELFGNPLEALAGLANSLKSGIKKVTDALAGAVKLRARSVALKNLAISIAILAGSLFLLSKLSWGEIGKGIAALGALSVIMVALSVACTKLNKAGTLAFGLNSGSIAAIALALLALAASLKLISSIDPESMQTAVKGMIVVIGGLVAVMFSLSKITDGAADVNFKGLGKVFTKLALSLLIMVGVIKLMSMLKISEIAKGTVAIGAITILYRAIIGVCKGINPEAAKQVGKTTKRISVALLLMIGVIKLASMLTVKEITKGGAVIIAIGLFFAGIIALTEYLSASKGAAESIRASGNLLLKLSASLLAMTLAIKIIAGIDGGDLVKAVATIYAIGGLYAALIYISNFSGQNAAKAGLMILELSGAMLIMVALTVILKELDPSGIIKALGVMTWITALFAGLIAITYFAKYADKVKGTLISLTVALGILAVAIVTLSLLDSKKVAVAAGALSTVIGMFALLIYATSYLNSGKKAFIRNLATIVVLTSVVAAIGGVIFRLSGTDANSAIGASTAIGELLLALSVSMAIIGNSKSLTRKSLSNTYLTIAGLVVVVAALGGIISDLTGVDPISAIGSAIAIGILLLAMSKSFDVIANSKSITKANLSKILEIMVLLTAIVFAIGLVINSMNGCNPISAIGSATAIGIVLLAMSKSFDIITKSKSISKANMPRILATLVTLTAAIAVIGQVIKSMNGCNPISAIGSATAIGILLAALSASFWIISNSGSINAKELPGIIVSLAMLTAVTFAVSKVIAQLSKCDPSSAIGAAYALSILLTALSLATIPLAIIGNFAGSAIAGSLALTSMVIPLTVFAFAISKLPDVTSKQATVEALVKLMAAMALLLVPLTLIGALAPLALLGIVALTAMIIPLGTFAKKVAELPDITAASNNISILISLMDSMTNILMKVTPLAPLALVGVDAIEELVLVVTAFGGLAAALGGLITAFPSIQTFISTGITLLEQLAAGLGRVIGSFITGFSSEVMTILPILGVSLTLFMLTAMPFITGLKMVDDSVTTGAKNLATAILALVGAEFVSSIISFLSLGTSSLISLGAELSGFMLAAWPFFSLMSQVDPSVIEATNTIAQAMLNLTKAQMLDAIASFLGADLNLGEFGTQLQKFGECIVKFSDSVNGANINEETVKAAANAGLIMAKLQGAIEPIGGVIQAFKGTKDLGYFGSQLELYGGALCNFSKVVSSDGAINKGAIQAASDAGQIMAGLQEGLEPTKGVLQFFTGTTDLETFGTSLEAYGTSLSKFSKSISGENAIDADAISSAASLGQALGDVQKSLPDDKILDGKMNLSQFGAKIASYGGYIASYSKKISGVDSDAIDASASYSKQLVEVAKGASGIDDDKVEKFKKIKGIGDAIKGYYDKISGVDSGKIFSSISVATRLKNLISSLTGLDASGVSTFKKAVNSLGETNVSGVVKAFNGSAGKMASVGGNLVSSITRGMSSKSSGLSATANSLSNSIYKSFASRASLFVKIGAMYVSNMAKGITSYRSRLIAAVGSVSRSAASSGKSYFGSFYDTGKYLVIGFASGISANTFRAEAKARAMAKAASDAAKEQLKVNSPSKVFMKHGASVVEGFTKGISDNTGDVVSSSKSMAKTSINSFSKAVSKVYDYLNGDVETKPTIRPVLDLSDVKSGAATIGSMFGSPSIGIMSNFGAISSTMTNRNQNGVNDDVVYAINKLRKDLGNVGNTTYSINGITYDDGSNISEAIQTLVRAAIVERRS